MTSRWRDCLIAGHLLSDWLYKVYAVSVWTSLLFYLWTLLGFQGSNVLCWILGSVLSLPPSARTPCLDKECLHHEAKPFVQDECPLLVKSDYVLLGKWCIAGPTIYLSTT